MSIVKERKAAAKPIDFMSYNLRLRVSNYTPAKPPRNASKLHFKARNNAIYTLLYLLALITPDLPFPEGVEHAAANLGLLGQALPSHHLPSIFSL